MRLEGRFVGVLFGPPGAGKSTAARLFDDVTVFDRDEQPWSTATESAFTAALEQLAGARDAAAVVIRTGATDSARSRALRLCDATHAWILDTPRQVCHERVKARGRDPVREHPAIEQWWRNYERAEHIPRWPGIDQVDLDAARVRPTQLGPAIAPTCPRCSRRHLPQLRCWEGRYRAQLCEQVYRTKGRLCWTCRREGSSTRATTVDHVIPRSLCGTDAMSNLEPACQPHNLAKGDKLVSPYGPVDQPAGNGRPVSSRFR